MHAAAADYRLMESIFLVRGAGAYWRMMMAQKRKKVKHDLDGIKPTIDILMGLDDETCWICSKHVYRGDASMDHTIPKRILGSLRFYKSFATLRLAHVKCNRDRGSPVPTPFVIRWDRLPEHDYEYARSLVRKMEYYWKDILPRDVARFVYDGIDVVPKYGGG